MPSFFDPNLLEKGGGAFIREGKIDEALRRLIAGAHISKGSYSCPSRSELRDLVWNHMDQNHRPLIHRTYGDASRIFIDRRASFSLTRFGRWPIAVPVFDGYFKENGFYQIIVLFGLIVVVNVIECSPDGAATRMDVNWAIASHRWLRFLHPLLNRRLVRLNQVQNGEDDPIRDRRVALRAAGYRFKTDDPDFMNSNVIDSNAIFPPVKVPADVALSELPDRSAVRVPVAERAFVLRRIDDAVDVWPGVCPHEGAELAADHLCENTMRCPWHGLEFPARRLTDGGSAITMCGARLQIIGGRIAVQPAPSDIA